MPKTESQEQEVIPKQEAEYKCKYCYRVFRSQEDLEDHEELHEQLEREDSES